MTVGEAPSRFVQVSVEELEATAVSCLRALGVGEGDASAVASVLVYADLRGVPSHGVHRLSAYMRRVSHGLAGGTEQMSDLTGTGAVRRLDAGLALGPAAAVKAIDLATNLATEHGISFVAVGRVTHFGAAGYYVRRAAKQGFLAVAASNGPAAVAPAGAGEALLGTNPLAVGIPLGRHGEFVLDMSTAASARERIRLAAEAGEPIEPGLAIDKNGVPTTDPAAALAGALLPAAGPKGSGLALCISLLAGALCGAELDFEIGSMYSDFDRPQNLGQIFAALDPGALGETRDGTRRGEELVDQLHALQPAPGADQVRFPGEAGEERTRRQLEAGVTLTRSTLEGLAATCDELELGSQAHAVRALAAARR
jgi:LDH2 family malate/lactate/ureidoglycolate dehydrogenase